MSEQAQFNEIGRRPIRPDGPDKVTGSASFAADMSLPGMLFGKVLRSPHAHAKIINIDTSKAEALDGVEAVVTSRDFSHLRPGGIGDIARDNLAHDKALYHGHGVAAIAARTLSIAEAALELIDVEYEMLTPVMSLDDAMGEDAVLLHEDLITQGIEPPPDKPSNICQRTELGVGDVEVGFREADVIVEREYTTPTVHQGYIEPPSCLAHYVADGQSVIWASTQGHFVLRDSTAAMVGIESSRLKVVPMEIGGGFGGKIAPYQEAIALVLSKKSGRPVKMTMTREEVFRAGGPGSATKIRIKIGARKDGTITAMQAWLAYEAGAFPGGSMGGGARCIFASYDVENIYIEGVAVVVNKPKVRAYRGPGASQAAFAAESALNELAGKLGIDPIELRLKNAVRDGTTSVAGVTFTEIGLVECLEAARNSAHYRSALQANQGRAVAVGFWHTGGGASSASVHMNPDGTASVTTGSADLSGTRITMAMMAAEALCIPVSKVSTSVADTESVGYTSMSAGSRTTNATGMAVIQAAQDVVEKMKNRAASSWNITLDQVEWRDGKAINTTRDEELTVKEICRNAPQTGGPLAGQASLNAAQGQGSCFSVHICDVDVDPETGKTSLIRYTAIQDAGKAIHPTFLEGQFQGGAVQGIGWALNEEYVYDERGMLENPGFLDYRIPVASDLPMIETVIVEVPSSGHPFGVRGVGEAPIIPPLAAVASAVSDAIGVPITDLPCSPEKVLEAIHGQLE
ncbi:MAG: xanthine dehydrogenase family protein molybdopterin-binding subunit [Pseudomonadales bacterium]